MPQEVAININTNIWCSVSQKWEMAAFHAAMASLEPNTRVQTVTFTDKKILDGAKETLHNSTPFVLSVSIFSSGEFPVASGTSFCSPTSI